MRWSVHGSCLVDNETGDVRLEALDTPRNRRKLCRLADRLNRREAERVGFDRLMRQNRAAWA